MDKDLEKILKRAKRDEPAPEKPKETGRVFPKNRPYDHLVFTKLVWFTGFYPVIFLIIFPAAMCVGFLFPDSTWIVIYCLLIYAVLIAVYLVVNLIRFRLIFMGWQERLPFELKGWNEMIWEKKMFCDLCWNDTRIEVVLHKENAEMLQLINASLTIFAKRSQKAFYTRKTGSSSTRSRQDWKLKTPTIAEGSANPEVMRHLKNLFERELSTISRKTNAIRYVQVTLLSEEFQIDIEIETGNT